MNRRPTVLTIAGFDPSGCAGVLADIKTLEAHDVYGIAVCTANTYQNDIHFSRVVWIDADEILAQLDVLQERFKFQYVKIGLIENLQVLGRVIDRLNRSNNTIKIIWDPILEASAGYEFHPAFPLTDLESICKKLYLVTPNLPELWRLFPDTDIRASGRKIAQWCNVLVKGGHSNDSNATDVLFTGTTFLSFHGQRISTGEKRGTGCVLSSAIAANLACGFTLEQSCRKAKKYLTQFIKSSNTRIGYHLYS
ncbi:MAG: hydroxymethylpyrimidine/phosphomethylpyrimidine kinase [Bacteroidetes bacterium]|nr:hydroxymethylpyrimidine/phosphomethylpyrimidine kinase [Bacteroidota bacterium]